VDSAVAQRVGAAFEALLLQQLLAPLARDDAALGSYGSTFLAQSIADRDALGFGAALVRVLERRP
jgi:hypothetical protein